MLRSNEMSALPRVINTPEPMTPLLNIAEVARLLAVSTITIRRKVSTGELRCVRLTKGGPMRFDLRDVQRFVEQHKS
jgi:excisionase family DNA binding protein